MARWIPNTVSAWCDECKAGREYVEGKCPHCASPLAASRVFTHVTVTLRADDARELFDSLMNGSMDAPAWEWRIIVTLADALGETLPEWMRERATA